MEPIDSTFPTTRDGLHAYIHNAVEHINADHVRFGVAAPVLLALNNKIGDASTEHTYEFVYIKCSNIATCTTPLTAELGSIEVDVKHKLSDIYESIPTNVWTDDDRFIFNRKKGLERAKPNWHPAVVKEEVFFEIKPIGNATFEFTCRTTTDGSRASKPEGATGVEVIYAIWEYKNEAGQPLPPGSPKKLPVSIKECPYKQVFTKAKFEMEIPLEHVGKYIVVYVRWVNIKHPEANGKYCGPQAADVR